MRKLVVAALLAACAMPAQAATVVEIQGNAMGWLTLEDYSAQPLWTSSVLVSGVCGTEVCELNITPSGFSILADFYHAYSLEVDFVWDTPPADFLDGTWHPGKGSGLVTSGYIAPGYEYATLSFVNARMFDDGTFPNGDDAPSTTFGTRYAVPEPATWTMLIAGFSMAGAAMRRRRMAVKFA